MKRRLSNGAISLVFLVLIVLGGNQIIISLFSKFTDKLILENHELNALQELKGALGMILIEENQYIINQDDIKASVDHANDKLIDCSKDLSDMHSVLQHVISHQNLDLNSQVDLLINETLKELNEYEEKSYKVKLHGTITIVIISSILILVLIIGSIKFIRGLTQPIGVLLDTTKKITEGDRSHRAKVKSDDEFRQLGDSINFMLDALNESSLSERYLSKILNNLYGALLVTDANGKIRTINTSTLNLLKYSEEELLKGDLSVLFSGEEKPHLKESNNLNSLSEAVKKQTTMIDSAGKQIPVYVTSIILKNEDDIPEGLVIVGHDLTLEKENEAKIGKIRKEGMIAINEAQELERLRISRDMHDGLGQLLTGISYSTQKLEENSDIDQEVLKRIQAQVNSAIQEAKNISHDLTPIVLKDFGLPAAIENLVKRINQLKKTQFIFKSYSFDIRIDEKLEKALFRIAQEAANNIIKHANANKASIELYRVEDVIVLVIEDDGSGFDVNESQQSNGSPGLGLLSMKERVNTFDGDFTINSNQESGTEIIIEIPCRKKIDK